MLRIDRKTVKLDASTGSLRVVWSDKETGLRLVELDLWSHLTPCVCAFCPEPMTPGEAKIIGQIIVAAAAKAKKHADRQKARQL